MSEAPDYATAVAGARGWILAPTLWASLGGVLWSGFSRGPWPNGKEMVAECERGHPAPAADCSCGVHAWVSAERLRDSMYWPQDHQRIAGIVAGAGRVRRGKHSGYWVAERVVVLAFFEDGHPVPKREVLPGSGVYLPTKEDAANIYGVPTIRLDEFDDFCDSFDPPLFRFEEGR